MDCDQIQVEAITTALTKAPSLNLEKYANIFGVELVFLTCNHRSNNKQYMY